MRDSMGSEASRRTSFSGDSNPRRMEWLCEAKDHLLKNCFDVVSLRHHKSACQLAFATKRWKGSQTFVAESNEVFKSIGMSLTCSC